MAAARSRRTLVTAWRRDTAKALRYPDVNRKIVLAILVRGPAGEQGTHVMPQFITDLQSLGRRDARLLPCPATTLEGGDGFPVTPSVRDNILSSHCAQNSRGNTEETPWLVGGADGARTRDLRRDRPAFRRKTSNSAEVVPDDSLESMRSRHRAPRSRVCASPRHLTPTRRRHVRSR